MFKFIYRFFHRHYHLRYHGVYKHAKKLFVFDLVLLAFALTMLGSSMYFILHKPGVADQIELNISIGTDRIKSGDDIKLTIDYTNRSKEILDNATLAILLPKGFTIDREKTPTSLFSENSTFNVGVLSPGTKGQATIYGALWSEPKTDEKIIATFSYELFKKQLTEQAYGTYLLSLPESILHATIDAPDKVFPNKSFPIKYTLENTSAKPIFDISFSANQLPVSFKDATDKITLLPNETKTFVGEASVTDNSNLVKLEIETKILANNHVIKQTTVTKPISIYRPEIYSSARTTGGKTFADYGSEIPAEISWKNNSNFELKNIKLRLNFTPGTIDLKATAKENNLKISGTSLIADASNRTALADGKTGSSDTFSINLKFASSFAGKPAGQNKFKITPTVEAEIVDFPDQIFTQTGVTSELPLVTEVGLKAEVRYYTIDGDQLGRGSLPPVVGQTTKYWVMIQASNTGNSLQDATMNIVLQPGAEFTGKQNVTIGPTIKINKTNNSASWSYYSLPANSVTGLYLEVAVTPTADQVGATIPLIKSVTFSATDALTGKVFNLSKGALSNVLSLDDQGANKGAEVKAE